MKFKAIVLNLLHKTDKKIFCFIRNILEYIFFKQDFNLSYENINNFYYRKYHFQKIFFPKKLRTIMYGRGYNFRLSTLSKFYFLNKIKYKKGDKIIDCGANIGEIFIYFKAMEIKVDYYAFEPSIVDYNCLKLNITNNLNLYNKALWKENGKFNFFTKAGTADSSLFEIENYDDKLQVDCITLDSLNIKDIKLLKIEAEGAEPEVLIGAKNTLKECEYIVVDSGMERGLSKEETTQFVCNFLITNNFKLIHIDHKRITLMFKNNLK